MKRHDEFKLNQRFNVLSLHIIYKYLIMLGVKVETIVCGFLMLICKD